MNKKTFLLIFIILAFVIYSCDDYLSNNQKEEWVLVFTFDYDSVNFDNFTGFLKGIDVNIILKNSKHVKVDYEYKTNVESFISVKGYPASGILYFSNCFSDTNFSLIYDNSFHFYSNIDTVMNDTTCIKISYQLNKWSSPNYGYLVIKNLKIFKLKPN